MSHPTQPDEQSSDHSSHRAGWWPWALLGLLGCALIAPLPFADGFLPYLQELWIAEHCAWLRHRFGRVLLRLTALGGAILLFWAWLRLRPTADARPAPRIWIGLGWTLPFWLTPPLNTADPFAYAAQGWLLSQGMNPYEVAMGNPSPFSETIYPAWRSTTAVYPPLALHLQGLVVTLTGSDPYWSVVAMRGLAMAGYLVMVLLAGPLARTLRIPAAPAQWAIALNPLIITQFVGGAHNDALMVAMVMVALWLARQRHGIIWGSIAVGVAAALKQPAVFAVPGVVWFARYGAVEEEPGAPRRPVRWGPAIGWLAAGGALAGAVFLATSIPGDLWLGWLGPGAGSPSLVVNHSPLSWLAHWSIVAGAPVGVVDRAAQLISGLAVLGGLVWLVRRFGPHQPIRLTAGSLLVFGLFGPAIQAWYVLWGGPLLAFVRPSARLVRGTEAVVLMLTLSAILQDFWSPVVTVPVTGIPVLAWHLWRTRGWGRRRTPVTG